MKLNLVSLLKNNKLLAVERTAESTLASTAHLAGNGQPTDTDEELSVVYDSQMCFLILDKNQSTQAPALATAG